MNSTFRVVFNKARGSLMVVNELTKTVQAKGTKTVVAALATVATLGLGISSVAEAADNPTVIEQDLTIKVEDKVPAYKDTTVTLKNDATLTINGVTNQYGFIAGATLGQGGSSVVGDGHLVLNSKGKGDCNPALGELIKDVDVNSIAITSENYGIYKSDWGVASTIKAKTINVNAFDNAFYTSNTDPVTFKGFDTLTFTSTDGHAVNNNGASTVTFEGGNVTLKSENRGALSTMAKGAKTVFDVNNLIVDSHVTVASDNSHRKTSAVFVSQGELTINANDKFSVKATKSAKSSESNGLYASNGGKLNVNAKQINIEVASNGITAIATGQVTIDGENLNIKAETESGWIGGLWAANLTPDSSIPDNAAKIVINAANTTIAVKSGTTLEKDKSVGGLGVVAMSNGTVEVNGNLTVEAEDAVLTRGHSNVLINQSGKNTVKLTGNVDFNYDSITSGTVVDSTAKIKLTNADSFWTGRALATSDSTKGDIKAGEVDIPSINSNFQIGKTSDGLVLELSNGGTWNITGNSFATTLTLENGGVVKGGKEVGKLHVDNFAVKGAGNVFTLDATTNLNGTITFADQGSELITNLDTAYTEVKFSEQEANGGKVSVLDGAKGNLKVEAKEGGTLSVMDSFTYSSAGLSSLAEAYKGLTLKLDNASLYVAPKKPDETGSTTMDIPSSAEVTLPTQGGNDISGGADNFNIQGTVNIVANEGTETVEANNKATLSSVNVEGSTTKPAVLNLHEVEATADAITVKNATLAVGSELAATAPDILKSASLDVTDLVADEGASVFVGNHQAQGLVKVNKFSSKTGSIVFADPAWNTDPSLNTVSNASGMAVAEVSGDINGTVAAGRNSFFAFGTDLATAQKMVENVTTWGASATGAAVVVATPITISSTGMVIADASATSASTLSGTAGTLTVATGSALVVDQNAMPESGALITGDVVVTGGTLGVVNAKEGAFNIATTVTGVDGSNIVIDNPFLKVDDIADGVLTTSANTAALTPIVSSFGMQAMTRRADASLAASVADRTSFDQRIEEGLSLWVDVSGETYEADKLDNGGSFKSDMGYAVFGADIGVVPAVRAGVALQYATGSLRSDVANAKNDFDAFGLTAYGSWQPCEKGMVVGELAYTQGTNDLSTSVANVSNDVDTKMYSAGVRAQYKGTLGQFTVVPSIGIRVSHLETDGFAFSGVNVENQKQNIVQLPIAVRVNGAEFDANGWKLAPSFKVAYVPTFGDKEITIRSVDSTVLDTSPVQGEFGIRAANGSLMLNANMLIGGGKDGASNVGAKLGVRYLF